MLIDLTCPAEIFRTEMPTEEMPAAQLTLFNLSDRVIVSVEATLKLTGKNREEREKVVYRARALNGRPHSTFQMAIPCPPADSAAKAEASIEKVWFADNAVWRRDPGTAIDYIPNELPISRGLTALKYVAGETAVGFPSQQNGLWVCVCGRPNPDSEEFCARCRRQKATIFARYNREAVEKQIAQKERQLEINTRSAREDTARLQRIREEEYNRAKSRKSRRIHIAIAAGISVAVIAGAVFGAAPGLRLVSGGKALEEGRLKDAEAIYQSLGNFGNAESQLAETRYRIAKDAAENSEDPDEIAAAAAALREMDSREDAAALADEAELRLGQALLEGGDWEKARKAASRIVENSTEKSALLDACLFAEAKTHLETGEYDRAREQFLSLGNYEDAADLANECVYAPCLQLIEEGDYDTAIARLGSITNYQDSRTLILKCHYLKGLSLEKAGDVDGAAAEYLLAADYEDAREKHMAMTFAQAEAALAAGDITKAAPLFSSIPDYPGAKEKSWHCLYTLGQEAFADTEYLRALELIATVPDEYEKTGDLRIRSSYLAGTAAVKRKDWESAVSLLEAAGDYKDAETQLVKARKALIEEKLEAGDLTGAERELGMLSEDKDWEKLHKQLSFLTLKAGIDAGADPEETLVALIALDYDEAKETIQSLYYTLGEQAAERREALVAAEYYIKAGSYRDAETKAAAQYDEYYGERAKAIRDAMDQKEYALAATLLESLDLEALPPAYKDLKGLYPNAQYEAGMQLYNEGKIYEALPWFRAAAPNLKQAANRLKAPCYQILGQWADKNGTIQAEFREDGTCTIAGETMVFRVADSYTLETGETAEKLGTSIRISDLSDNHLGLRDLRKQTLTVYNLTRVGNVEKAPAATKEGTADNGDFTVSDE